MKKFKEIAKWVIIVIMLAWVADAAGCSDRPDAYIHSQGGRSR